MKKSILRLTLLGSIGLLGLVSCDKVKDTLFPAFNTDIPETTVTIPITMTGVKASASNTVSINLDSVIKEYTANTFGFDNLSSVKVKDLTIALANADSQNDLSNFTSVTVQLFSNTNRTPVVVASAAIPDKPASELNIVATDCPELKDYLWGNQLTYTVSGTARRPTTKPLTASVLVTMAIK